MEYAIPGMISGVLIVFMVIVVPIWLILHYTTKLKSNRGLNKEDEAALAEMWEASERMEERIRNLETILDARSPGWRDEE